MEEESCKETPRGFQTEERCSELQKLEIKKLEKMSFVSSFFRSMNDLPKEDEQIEEEGPCTSYSHQGDKERSRRKTPSFGGKKEGRLSKLLPRSVNNISEDIRNIRREMYK